MKLSAVFSILICGVFIFGCSRKDSSNEQESTLSRSYRLIDSNKVDDAIELLSAEIDRLDEQVIGGQDKSPEATRLRVTLASAYAKKSGFSVREMSEMYKMGQKISGMEIVTGSIDKSAPEANSALKDVSNLLLTHLKAFQYFAAIHQIDRDKLTYLEQAVRVLNNCPELDSGQSIYSAVLKVVLWRSYFQPSSIKNYLPQVQLKGHLCSVQMEVFTANLEQSTRLLLGAIKDLQHALPDQKEQLDQNATTIIQYATSATLLGKTGITVSKVNAGPLLDLFSLLGIKEEMLNCTMGDTSS